MCRRKVEASIPDTVSCREQDLQHVQEMQGNPLSRFGVRPDSGSRRCALSIHPSHNSLCSRLECIRALFACSQKTLIPTSPQELPACPATLLESRYLTCGAR